MSVKNSFFEINPFFLQKMSRNYKFHNKEGLYFVSFATVNWIDVFTRQLYFDVLIESINYCRAEKGMELYAYCFMPSHVHFVFRSTKNNPAGLLRDFKRHTSRKMVEAIENNPQESRREWLLEKFEEAAYAKRNVWKYQFWQHHNKPIELWSEKVIKQKIDYIHNNPVASGFVTETIQWKYSSARNFEGDHTILIIDEVGFIG